MDNPIDTKVIDNFNEIKNLVKFLELDAYKNSNGNIAAGLRLRKGLRLLKVKIAELVKLTVEIDKKKNT